ncbi:hypothetical protein D5041_12110 [Verminephrobacter aporrectodeae subsp. tuberculatae]|nr:hypothetical protein [Verminephrobacter aporrectodeae subsp. tuberculatae]MCW5289761.1 hypothetical protein [Verminephrobacter aporrectodeae subsp. tuberculatae]MCW8177588.1 hypothetical protein [Verminephrobacter aporrectodeae subsp. tuberculatae]MCW8205052.1 hypothetical protein [Verminephrobacter aporrectodeae subsp. tuberculatae]
MRCTCRGIRRLATAQWDGWASTCREPHDMTDPTMHFLSPAVQDATREDGARILLGERAYLVVEDPGLVAFCDRLRAGLDRMALLDGMRTGHGATLLRKLLQFGWLVNEAQADRDAPWARQHGFLAAHSAQPASCQVRLAEARVCVLGLGGIGGVVLQHLVGAGISKFLLIDDDCIEPSNMNRQFMFRAADAGRPKVEVAAQYVLERHTGAHVDVVRTHVDSRERLFGLAERFRPDLLIVAADRPFLVIERMCAGYCDDTDTAYLAAAASLSGGFAGPLVVPEPGERRCEAFVEAWMDQLASACEGFSPRAFLQPSEWSYGPSNTIAAALAADLAIRHLADIASPSTTRQRFSLGPIRVAHFEPDSHLEEPRTAL